jgi:hypothetical protein
MLTPEQRREFRIAVLRSLLHPSSNIAALLDDVPAGDIRECVAEITGTLTARLELMKRATKARLPLRQRAKNWKRKG